MEKIFESFTISILKLYKLVQKIKTYEMEGYGLKSIHVMCVYYLNECADGLTASELSRLTFEDKAAISRAIRLLEEKGFIQSGAEKYNSIIRLTNEGKKLAAHIMDKCDRAVDAGKADLTDTERVIFYKALKDITESLQSYYNGLIGNGGGTEGC